MEISVWTQLYAAVAPFISSLFASLSNPRSQNSGGASPSAPASGVGSTLTSTNAISLLRVIRNPAWTTTDGVFGSLTFKGEQFCFTMENRALLIPAGRYGLEIYDSPHVGHPVPLLQNVVGRSEIEMHCGNTPQDSKGCIIVADSHIGDTVENSRVAFDRLFPIVQAALKEGPQFIEIE
jgi:Family of unknown function (DUF5675)